MDSLNPGVVIVVGALFSLFVLIVLVGYRHDRRLRRGSHASDNSAVTSSAALFAGYGGASCSDGGGGGGGGD